MKYIMKTVTLRNDEYLAISLCKYEMEGFPPLFEVWSLRDDYHGYAERLIDVTESLDEAEETYFSLRNLREENMARLYGTD